MWLVPPPFLGLGAQQEVGWGSPPNPSAPLEIQSLGLVALPRYLDSDLSSLSCRPEDGSCKTLVHNLITNYSVAYYLEHFIRTVRMAL